MGVVPEGLSQTPAGLFIGLVTMAVRPRFHLMNRWTALHVMLRCRYGMTRGSLMRWVIWPLAAVLMSGCAVEER